MKKLAYIIIYILASVPAIVAANPSIDERLENGAIIKDVTTPDDSQWAFVRVETVVDVPVDTLWRTIIDIEEWPEWLPMTSGARFISAEAEGRITREIAKSRERVYAIDKEFPPNSDNTDVGSGRWHRTTIEEYDLIWPLKNEWVVRRYDFDEVSTPHRASWRKLDNNDDIEDGAWEIGPWKDGKKSLLKYSYRVKVKEGVPRPVFRQAVSFTVNSMIKALRREAARRAKLDFLGTVPEQSKKSIVGKIP